MSFFLAPTFVTPEREKEKTLFKNQSHRAQVPEGGGGGCRVFEEEGEKG